MKPVVVWWPADWRASDFTFHRTTKAVTRTFSVGCGKEVPFSIQAEIFQVHDEIADVFILARSTVTELVDFVHRWHYVFDVGDHLLLRHVHGYGLQYIVVHSVANNAQTGAFQLSFLDIIDNKRVKSALAIVPVKPLSCTLNYKRVFFSKVDENYDFSVRQIGFQ